MRTISTQDTALLNSPCSAHRVWIKVEISDATNIHTWGGETWYDLTDLNGFDWVLGCEYGEDIDTPAWDATIRVLRQIGDNPLFSLSPFISGSINATTGVLIQPYRKVRISTAFVPLETPRASATFNTVFVGRIDSYSMAGNEITINCRDRTADLQEYFIEYEKEYGSDTPTVGSDELDDVIQDILDDHYNTTATIGGSAGSPFTLYSQAGTSGTPWNASDDTGWYIRKYTQQKMTVWQAIMALAENIQYQLRFRYHEGSGINDFVLVCENPDRAKSTADFTLDPTGGSISIDSVSLDRMDVKNFLNIGYALNGGEATSKTFSDATSITKYGRRFMELQEGANSQIDTDTEVTTLGNGILAETKEPTATVQLTAPYLWFAQLNDLVAISADNYYFDSQQKLAILSRRNTLTQGGRGTTSLVCTGVPKTGMVKNAQKQRVYQNKRNSPSFTATSINYGGILVNASFATNTNE